MHLSDCSSCHWLHQKPEAQQSSERLCSGANLSDGFFSSPHCLSDSKSCLMPLKPNFGTNKLIELGQDVENELVLPELCLQEGDNMAALYDQHARTYGGQYAAGLRDLGGPIAGGFGFQRVTDSRRALFTHGTSGWPHHVGIQRHDLQDHGLQMGRPSLTKSQEMAVFVPFDFDVPFWQRCRSVKTVSLRFYFLFKAKHIE